MKNNKNPFWAFSVHIYKGDNFAKTILRLQDEYGLNVNNVLLMLWAGLSGAKLTDDSVARVMRHSQAWQDSSVLPLRKLRLQLKADVGAVKVKMSADFREKVKALELDAEKIEQDMLMELLLTLPAVNGRQGDRKAIARRNLLTYLIVKEVKVDAQIKEIFEILLKKAEAGFLMLEYAKNESSNLNEISGAKTKIEGAESED